MPKIMDLGGMSVERISGGKNRVDGGGMLGILPKAIWNRWYPADDKNRIWLETHCLLIRIGEETLLVETGCGNRLTEKERAFYSVEESDWIGANLAERGIGLEDIDKVLLTHLHTDHAGGCVSRDSQGRLIPTFPNAEIFVTAKEWEIARSGKGITPNAYNRENFEPLNEAGKLHLVEPGEEVSPGIRFLATPGHTMGHASISIRGEERTLVFTGDLIPLAKQIVPYYNMAYDTDPVVKTETKREFLATAAREGWILVFSHEPIRPVCSIVEEGETGRYSLREIDD